MRFYFTTFQSGYKDVKIAVGRDDGNCESDRLGWVNHLTLMAPARTNLSVYQLLSLTKLRKIWNNSLVQSDEKQKQKLRSVKLTRTPQVASARSAVCCLHCYTDHDSPFDKLRVRLFLVVMHTHSVVQISFQPLKWKQNLTYYELKENLMVTSRVITAFLLVKI